MKTEQEVREAITEGIGRLKDIYIAKGDGTFKISKTTDVLLSTKEVQDLAVIIGKALGVVE